MVIRSGRNLTNRLRNLLGLPATDLPGQAPDREASTVVADRRETDDGADDATISLLPYRRCH